MTDAANRQQKCSSPLRFRSGGKEKEKNEKPERNFANPVS
jgi:hypothetical protein